MGASVPARSESPFEWNAGAWFGAQVGASCWMLLAALVLLGSDVAAAGGVGLVFVAANGAGWLLWSRRERMPAYRGILLLIVVLGVAALAALVWIDVRGQLPVLWRYSAGVQPGSRVFTYALLLVYPAVAAMVWARERSARAGG